VATRKDRAVLRQIRTLFNVGAIRELTDGQLLERFATGRGEAAGLAFAALVERHGPMVLRVCRGVLGDPHEAQDAFQATFLVLVEKARGLWVRDSLGPWLHQVAVRTASCARAAAARRLRHERRACEMAAGTDGQHDASGDDLERVLHAEIDRLPECYRAPIVLCDLEGRSHEQAARHLGWPIGTVKSRQARGRERLRRRLLRRGLAPSAGLGAALAAGGAQAEVPPALLASTTSAAVRSLAARTIARGAAGSLAKEVLRTMAMTRGWKIASTFLVFAATAAGVPWLAQRGASGDEPRPKEVPPPARAADLPVAEVKSGKLTVTLVERGVVEASHSESVYCTVEGQTTIIKILPEGTRVKKGDVVAELDSAALRDQLVNQEIAAKEAEAAYQSARLAREAAEIALTEYAEGVAPQERAALQGEMAATGAALKQAEDRRERTRRARQKLAESLAPKGEARTPGDIVAELDIEDRLDATDRALAREKLALERAKSKLDLLEKYTRPRTTRELTVAVEHKRAEELARKAKWELDKAREKKLGRMIAACRLLAPSDGIVVLANDPGRRPGPGWIEEGATVRERQKIFSLPDLSRFLVVAKVHEPRVDQVRPGQRVRVKVDAFSGEDLTGVVESVAPLPDPSSFFQNDEKVYSTRITLDRSPTGLRPGMSAETEIILADLDDALRVPVQAVVSYGGKCHVAVKKPDAGIEWREVVLGVTDGEVIEVRRGLDKGETVALDPLALMSEKEKREKLGSPTPPGRDAAKAGTKGARRSALTPPIVAKLRSLGPEDRAKLKGASPEERDAILKKAGLTDAEIQQLNRLRPPAGAPR
jgi:HlyD family secretion protein